MHAFNVCARWYKNRLEKVSYVQVDITTMRYFPIYHRYIINSRFKHFGHLEETTIHIGTILAGKIIGILPDILLIIARILRKTEKIYFPQLIR